MKGYVKWFNTTKGYGFIRGQDDQEYFVHYSEIIGKGFKNLEADQEVAFEAAEDSQGRARAVKVESLNSSGEGGERG
jgi:CspA family cold shock protein